jgi:hypothetical protein
MSDSTLTGRISEAATTEIGEGHEQRHSIFTPGWPMYFTIDEGQVHEQQLVDRDEVAAGEILLILLLSPRSDN